MDNWRDVWVAQEYRREQIQEADMWRLARLARSGYPRPVRIHYRLLAWFGQRLINWGQRMQQRYTEIALSNEALLFTETEYGA